MNVKRSMGAIKAVLSERRKIRQMIEKGEGAELNENGQVVGGEKKNNEYYQGTQMSPTNIRRERRREAGRRRMKVQFARKKMNEE